ncbi:unnamed protein product [Paramecium sonneborni]|uniref:Uncharacterized protein n=1 Tax=Paramecium sonneborni TaxID=65129 RepID=A0A8S1M121_9CILI|nr:unnamed protein product [Paramecium sonneborni]
MVFNYVIIVMMSISQTSCQFYSLESDNLIYPFYMQQNLGDLESGNIYNYNINNFGIDSLNDDFNIGIWVNPINYSSYYQLIMQINGNQITVIYYNQQIRILDYYYGYLYQSSIQNYWIYVYYQQRSIFGIYQICFIVIYYGPNPTCIELPPNNYYNFGFLQPSINLDSFFNYYYSNFILPFDGQAISITIKKMKIYQSFNFQMIDLMTLMQYIEPEVILDLKIYERIQTQILKDWSDYQHIVQMGNSLNSDSYDPLIIVNEQMLQFSNQQYIQIENFKISQSLTIEIQLSSDSISGEFIILSLTSRRLQSNIIKIMADFNYQQITILFSQYSVSFTSGIDFNQKLMIGILNLVEMTVILFIQNGQILNLNPYFTSIDIRDTDTLIIGSIEI